MSRVFKQQTNRGSVGILATEAPPHILHHFRKPSTYVVDGCQYKSSCIGCLNPRCIRFSADELKLPNPRLSNFPVDADDAVCPMNAIVWERGAKTPTILSERCINCGICARRCPFGAIYSDGAAGIVHFGEANVSFEAADPKTINQHETQINAVSECCHSGCYIEPSDSFINTVYEKLRTMQTEAQFPNLITRNFFLVLGNQCVIRRRGDVYFRIDALVSDAPSVGIAEVEFCKDSLESPRAILDDIAVLSSRYGIDKAEIKPFIVSLEFPNIRTEYWRVIKDIREVLGIQIHSLTLGALCLLAWSFNDAPIGMVNFYADIVSPSIKAEIERLSGFGHLPKLNAYAVLEPIK